MWLIRWPTTHRDVDGRCTHQRFALSEDYQAIVIYKRQGFLVGLLTAESGEKYKSSQIPNGKGGNLSECRKDSPKSSFS